MFENYLKEEKLKIEKILLEYLNEFDYPKVIAEGMKYSVLNGGKRLRPILISVVLELLGQDKKLGYPSGAAIEMIHSYSLVHDDLPALDNDNYRRGNLTTHIKFGEAEAILIGDALLTYAFGVLAEKNIHLSADKIVKIIALTSKHAGTNGMIGGQLVDIESEGKEIYYSTLQYIHANKTGKMIRLPMEIACIIAEADEKTFEIIKVVADLIGMAFQIKDDILDIEGEFVKIGKTVGSDINHKKSTYPSIFGMIKSKEMLKQTLESAEKLIKENFEIERTETILELIKFIGCRES
ncbi:MAG: polyprenyl synthetase family protein [Fusobacteriaceae bacterium]